MDDDDYQQMYQWLYYSGRWVNAVSPEGTVIFNNDGQKITDAKGQDWTLVNGKVYRNGATIGFTSGGTELAFKNGFFTVYHPAISVGAAAASYRLDENSTVWSQNVWPVPVVRADKREFYGVNIHHTWGGPYSNGSATVARMVEIGCSVGRTGMSSGDVTSLKQFISAYAAPAHVAVYPVFLPNPAADESASYVKGVSFGIEMAGLQGYVPMYELANEKAGELLVGNVNGDIATQYTLGPYLAMRGLLRGIVDGIRSIDKTTPLAMGDTWLHYGFTDMLWNGTNPASGGSADASKVVRWDYTIWHWYDDAGNIENAGNINANVLQHLKDTYGKPIVINEFGCYFSSFSDEAAVTAYLTGTNLYGKWDSKASTYNIVGCDTYELFDDGRPGDEGQFGVVLNDGVSKKSIRWTAVNAFVIAHPHPYAP